MGETNPFLHLSLHLSVIEQIGINQPIGIREVYDKLRLQHNDAHLAQHDVLDCLAEIIWQSQRNSQPLDSTYYLKLLNQKLN
jgi:predicted transcriptional regulator